MDNLKLYVIEGKEDAGKTSTCWSLLNKLKEVTDYIEYWELKSATEAHFDSNRNVYVNQNGNVCDFIVILRTKLTHKKIAIISAGDEAWLLKKDVFFVLSKDVRHIVCCSRTINRKNSTMQMIKDVFNHHIAWSQELTFTKNDIILKQKYEEEISEIIYQQFKESSIL